MKVNEFQIRSLFENRFGGAPEDFGMDVVSNEEGSILTGNGKTLELRIVNDMQAGWYLNDVLHCETPPNQAILKPNDQERITNGEALRTALA